jgi:biopolymer transport protein ExbB
MPAAAKPTDVYGDDLAAVHHFAQSGSAPRRTPPPMATMPTPRHHRRELHHRQRPALLGNNPVTIPNSESLTWTQGQDLTIQMWIKPSALQPNSVLLSRSDGDNSLRVILDKGMPLWKPPAKAQVSAASPARRSLPPHGLISPSSPPTANS